MFIDTHTHLYDKSISENIEAHIQRCVSNNVLKLYMPNCDSTTVELMLALSKAYPQYCVPMLGLHPCYVKENVEEELKKLETYLDKYSFAAIGEIGLDYYWDLTFKEQQKATFALQIDWALEYNLPVVIHSRESTQDCIDIVSQKQNGKLKGIFHCFGGTLKEAQQIVDLGLLLGIGGVVTFKKSTLPEVLQQIPLENIVLETDAPYLAPVPYRGKPNESSYIPIIAHKIAEIYGLSIAEIEAVTTATAQKLFPI